MGIFFAFLSLFGWGFGDFLIQKSCREFGKWAALFFVTATAAILLTPFVYKDILVTFSSNRAAFILCITSIVLLFTSLFNFQGLRDGKICVVVPICALEIPVAAGLASIFLSEHLSFLQIISITFLIVGIFFISVKSLSQLKKIKVEKGVIYAFLGAIGMGATNFLFGVGARETNPLMINWFASLVVAIITLIYILSRSRRGEILRDWHKDKLLIVGAGLIDNAAWIAYSYSTLFIPIAVATSISEAYIALAAILGLTFNHELLRKHQILGLLITVAAAITLAAVTAN
ncbi:DMT family transporter [Patescibacteria group bacterium]|nr:DMT family transporter [Patescibacteria group bacterium]